MRLRLYTGALGYFLALFFWTALPNESEPLIFVLMLVVVATVLLLPFWAALGRFAIDFLRWNLRKRAQEEKEFFCSFCNEHADYVITTNVLRPDLPSPPEHVIQIPCCSEHHPERGAKRNETHKRLAGLRKNNLVLEYIFPTRRRF